MNPRGGSLPRLIEYSQCLPPILIINLGKIEAMRT
jgi:hypothetical protein